MTYVVISPDGELSVSDRHADHAAVDAEVGEPGLDLVRLRRAPQIYAMVNDCGLVMDPPLARNPVAAVILAQLGAHMGVYAGPVVITGWQEPCEGSEIRDLAPYLVTFLRHVHAETTRVLGGGASDTPTRDQVMRDYAAHVRTAPAPGVQIVTGEDAWRLLAGGAQ